jgi:Zn-dependent protease with chaperone function
MHVLVYLPLMLPAIAALAARPLADRLPPAIATWLLAGSAVALAVASCAVLGLLALTALVRIPLAAAAGHWSLVVVSREDPASLPVAVVAGGLLAVAATAACGALWRRGRAIARAFRQARDLPGSGRVVITQDEAADAYTLPGWPCRIVVTTGMLRVLSGPERRVLLAHERAHAAWHHFLFTTAARLAAASNPLLRPVAATVAYTVERWADERAAALTGDRALAARAVARAALAANAARPRANREAAALGADGSPEVSRTAGLAARSAGPVPRRVAALLRPAPAKPNVLLLGAAVLLVVVAGASALEAARDLHALLEYASTTSG